MAVTPSKAPATKDNKVGKFFREVRAEMRKVQWPNRKELISYTYVTLATVGAVAVFIFIIDAVFSGLLRLTGLVR